MLLIVEFSFALKDIGKLKILPIIMSYFGVKVRKKWV